LREVDLKTLSKKSMDIINITLGQVGFLDGQHPYAVFFDQLVYMVPFIIWVVASRGAMSPHIDRGNF
jgi:hypothetical protein